MVEAYCRYMGEHTQRQGYLREFRVVMTRLSCAMWRAGR